MAWQHKLHYTAQQALNACTCMCASKLRLAKPYTSLQVCVLRASRSCCTLAKMPLESGSQAGLLGSVASAVRLA